MCVAGARESVRESMSRNGNERESGCAHHGYVHAHAHGCGSAHEHDTESENVNGRSDLRDYGYGHGHDRVYAHVHALLRELLRRLRARNEGRYSRLHLVGSWFLVVHCGYRTRHPREEIVEVAYQNS